MSNWSEVTLGDLCSRVTVGHVGKMADEYVEDGVPFLRSQNVRPFVIEPSGMLQVSESFHQKLRKSTLRAGDVVVVRTGYPGTAAVIPDHLDGSNCADLVVITPSESVNGHLLAAVFNSVWGKSAVGSQLVGSAQQHFNVGSAKALRVRLPERHVQDKIAAVLCALNDLIENNRRRVEVLEEMARAIYREWFVHFRYPGHEDATLVESPLGPIPEQWSVKCVADLSSAVTRGIAPKYAEDGSWVVINQKCIRDERVSLSVARRQERAVPETKRVQSGDVLINSTGVGTLGRVALYRGGLQNLTVDSHVTIVRPQDTSLNPWYGLSLVSKKPEFEQLSSGSTGQTELGRTDVGALRVVLPSPDTRMKFADCAWPLLSQADELLRWNLALAKLRDLLLPKLVTGQIDVSSLDLDGLVEGSVA